MNNFKPCNFVVIAIECVQQLLDAEKDQAIAWTNVHLPSVMLINIDLR